MFCPKCGTALPSGSVLCRRCRTSTISGNVPRPAAPGGGSRAMPAASLERPGLITLLAVLHFITAGLMALGVIGCLATLSGKNPIGLPVALLCLVFGAASFLTGI